MILTRIFLGTATLFSAMHCVADEASVKFDNENDKINYSVGYQIGGDFKRQGVTMSTEALARGIADALGGNTPMIDKPEMVSLLVALKKSIVTAQYEKQKAEAESRRLAGKKFLETNAAKDDVHTLPSGLQYRIVKTGSGGHKPMATDEVTVHYTGTLIDGTEFGSSVRENTPARFQVDKVIPGWTEALQLMREGDQWQVFLPPELGYGDRGPLADQILVYTIDLLAVEPALKKTALDLP